MSRTPRQLSPEELEAERVLMASEEYVAESQKKRSELAAELKRLKQEERDAEIEAGGSIYDLAEDHYDDMPDVPAVDYL